MRNWSAIGVMRRPRSRRLRAYALAALFTVAVSGYVAVRANQYAEPYRLWDRYVLAVRRADAQEMIAISPPGTFASLTEAGAFAHFAGELVGERLAGPRVVKVDPDQPDADSWFSTLLRGRRATSFLMRVESDVRQKPILILKRGPAGWCVEATSLTFMLNLESEETHRERVQRIASLMEKHGVERAQIGQRVLRRDRFFAYLDGRISREEIAEIAPRN